MGIIKWLHAIVESIFVRNPLTRRQVLKDSITGFAIMTAGAALNPTPAKAADAPEAPKIKYVNLLVRKEGLTREQFLQAWLEDHVQLARACPGIARYVLTVIDETSTRKDVAGLNIDIDGIAELYFADRAAFDIYNVAPETLRLRAHGATFIGRAINFVTHEKVAVRGTQNW